MVGRHPQVSSTMAKEGKNQHADPRGDPQNNQGGYPGDNSQN